jgi:flagellar basal-body rod modification protein FlgD
MNVTTATMAPTSMFGTKKDDSTAGLSEAALGQEQFLNLLIEQLKNQDPLNPMDSTDFTAQLAQFSSLGQLFDVNKNLAAMQDYSITTNRLSALSMIGKQVTFTGSGTVFLGEEVGSVPLKFDLADNANQVTLAVTNETGQEVTRLDLGYQDAGSRQISWDGLDENGQPLPAGSYHFQVAAADEIGNSVAVTLYGSGLVQGIETDSDTGQTVVVLASGQVPIDEIVGVRDN